MTIAELSSAVVDKGFAKESELKKLLSDPKNQGITLDAFEALLIDRGLVQDKDLLEVKAELFGVPVVELKDLKIEQEVLQLVPEPIARRHRVISFAKDKDGVSLAMMDPGDLQIKDFIKKKIGLPIKTFLISQSSLDAGVARYHTNLESEIQNLVGTAGPTIQTKGDEEPTEEGGKKLEKMAEEIPVVRVVDTLLEYAIFEKASDIHVEPLEKSVIVRYRIDGILHDVMTLPKGIQSALAARIKVLSNLKIDEHRLPQDGRFKVEKDGMRFSLRVSTIPVFDGEKIVMRLLDETGKAMTLEQLGFLDDQLEIVNRNIHKPHGCLLVTGPTGSGKSTTLYAVLTILNTRGVNISTIEDPVEYRIEGANQMQVNPKINLTFALGLRALLRQDPNIIMIGEIRDKETAEEAVHAAMTGHTVLSTLHTNSAAGALPRLLDIGVEPYLVASTVNAIVAQRLVRMLCQDCSVEEKLDAAFIESLGKVFHLDHIMEIFEKRGVLPKGVKKFEDIPFKKAVGCEKCSKTGYRSRIGIHEILEVTPQIGEMIVAKAASGDIQNVAEKDGMLLMWQDGFLKSLSGVTTLNEILRVSKE